jgi:molybdopterin-binding protein
VPSTSQWLQISPNPRKSLRNYSNKQIDARFGSRTRYLRATQSCIAHCVRIEIFWINARPGHTGNYRPFVFTLKEDIVGISARNQLNGKITEIVLGDVMAHITVRVGQNLIESVITRKSADELKLKKGDAVTVTVKATEVMIAKGE